MKKLIVLTGAGISAESGIKTFRNADGLWEGHDVMEVASPQGWNKNAALVLDFYNQRRRQLFEVSPNIAHKKLVEFEEYFDVKIITQNVDDLHERAGSSSVLHLHGELLKSRSIRDQNSVYECSTDIELGDLAPDGHQLRPHIVWFGESVPMMDAAIEETQMADVILIIGTSLQVYPAAGLVGFAKYNTPIYYLDPRPSISHELSIRQSVYTISENATVGISMVEQELRRHI